jgi:hypothetical protein
MRKLTKVEVFDRFQAVLAILGEEDCEDAQTDLRMKSVRNLFQQASQRPAINLDDIANDVAAT